jgi:hypothetical protein
MLAECDIIIAADHATFDPTSPTARPPYEPIKLLQHISLGNVLRLAARRPGADQRSDGPADRPRHRGGHRGAADAAAWLAESVASLPANVSAGTLVSRGAANDLGPRCEVDGALDPVDRDRQGRRARERGLREPALDHPRIRRRRPTVEGTSAPRSCRSGRVPHDAVGGPMVRVVPGPGSGESLGDGTERPLSTSTVVRRGEQLSHGGLNAPDHREQSSGTRIRRAGRARRAKSSL